MRKAHLKYLIAALWMAMMSCSQQGSPNLNQTKGDKIHIEYHGDSTLTGKKVLLNNKFICEVQGSKNDYFIQLGNITKSNIKRRAVIVVSDNHPFVLELFGHNGLIDSFFGGVKSDAITIVDAYHINGVTLVDEYVYSPNAPPDSHEYLMYEMRNYELDDN
jgi:hypothetical protein